MQGPIKVEFVGIPSGDGDCFCWDVDRETYTRIEGESPAPWGAALPDCVKQGDSYDTSFFNPGTYRLYHYRVPHELISSFEPGKPVCVRILIEDLPSGDRICVISVRPVE